MSKKSKALGLHEPLRHQDHPRPRTRREFLAQSFMHRSRHGDRADAARHAGLSARRARHAGLRHPERRDRLQHHDRCRQDSRSSASTSQAAATLPAPTCWSAAPGDSSISCRSPATASSGLPGTMVPNGSATGSFVDASFGLRYHSDSAHLRGMKAARQRRGHGRHDRHDHSGAVAERHEHQSAQSHVRHLPVRRARRTCSI